MDIDSKTSRQGRRFLLLLLILILSLVMVTALIPSYALGEEGGGDDAGSGDLLYETSSVELIQEGGAGSVSYDPDALTAQSSDSDAYQAIYKGLCAHESTIYMTGYNVWRDDFDALYKRIIDEHPELFFVGGNPGIISDATGLVTEVQPEYVYTAEELPAKRAEFYADANSALAIVAAQSTTLGKVHAVHDWLASNVSYDQTASKYDAYSAIVGKSALPRGCSMAADYLLEESGVGFAYVASKSMDDHAWNMAKVDTNWYHFDTAWDHKATDPTTPANNISHQYFFKSDSGMTDHHGWVTDDNLTCTDTTYDSWCTSYTTVAAQDAWRSSCMDVTTQPTAVSATVATAPTKTTYLAGDTFDASGLVLSVTFSNGVTMDSTNYLPATTTLASGQTEAQVSFPCSTSALTVDVPITTSTDLGTGTVLQIDDQTYTGYEITPSMNIYCGNYLVPWDAYTVSYADDVNAGTATVTATGTGTASPTTGAVYSGSITTHYTIKPAALSDAFAATLQPCEYTGSAFTPSLALTYNDQTLTAGTDYTLSYADNIKVGTATVTATGSGNFTGTNAATFTITSAQLSAATMTVSPSCEYTGSALEPSATLTFNGQTLTAGTDYTLSYANNTKVGTATVTATAKPDSDFTGKATTSFQITAAQLSAATMTVSPSCEYTGSALEPSATLTFNGQALTVGTDYTLTYADNTEVGTATVTATAKSSNFTGTKTANFQITPAQLSDATADALPSCEYTGSAFTPSLALTFNGRTLTAGTDYTLTYANNTEVGTATVTATAKSSNFTGTKTASFQITAAQLSAATMTMSPSCEYTGSALEPPAMLTFNGQALTAGTDYTLTYADNIHVGTATVTATGSGNFTGTKTANFQITALVARLAGTSRYNTTALISQQGFTGSCETVILVRGDDFPDALSAASLAGALGCPILTTPPTTLSPDAAAEITRLHATEVYILGGSNSISSDVEAQVGQLGCTTRRIAGTSRVDTAVKVAQETAKVIAKKHETDPSMTASDTCIITKSYAYADALAMSPYTYTSRSPVFLANLDGSISEEVVQAIKDGGYRYAIVLGGDHSASDPSAIAGSTMEAIKTSTSVTQWIRLSGTNRYETAEMIALWACGESEETIQPTEGAKLSYGHMAVARGDDFPDALASVDMLGPNRAALLLVAHDATDEVTKARIQRVIGGNASRIDEAYILGGTGSVGTTVEDWVRAAL